MSKTLSLEEYKVACNAMTYEMVNAEDCMTIIFSIQEVRRDLYNCNTDPAQRIALITKMNGSILVIERSCLLTWFLTIAKVVYGYSGGCSYDYIVGSYLKLTNDGVIASKPNFSTLNKTLKDYRKKKEVKDTLESLKNVRNSFLAHLDTDALVNNFDKLFKQNNIDIDILKNFTKMLTDLLVCINIDPLVRNKANKDIMVYLYKCICS